ncbi:hypothetical protein B0H10DRAFT_1999527 [Mycena sp. CBHHK59/15]|nr:hypothetical protein B0H10DRAFT_1999527 [Mycena sp. CBHHK59/15]
MSDPNVAFYGFTAVPRGPEVLLKGHPTASGEHPKQDLWTVTDFPLPDSLLANKVREFATMELDTQTLNHSFRVYVYGAALVKTHFPAWTYDAETYYLACMLHDIGTAERFLATTKMSFDGNITQIGQALQLATILGMHAHPIFFPRFHNVGIRANLVHPQLIATTTAAYPRNGWSEHFACVVEKELALKPWCHTSTFETPGWAPGAVSKFAADVRGNDVMRAFD